MRYNLSVDYRFKVVKYWCKLIAITHDRYIKKCYLQQFRHCESGRNNWASKIKHLLHATGFGHVWVMQQVGDEKLFLNCLKSRLQDISYQELGTQICEISNVHEFYKSNPFNDLPSYIQLRTSIFDRRIITLLRTRSLPVRNNLFKVNVVNDNICVRCSRGDIDDETHFLFTCPAYLCIRQNYPMFVSTAPYRQCHTHNEVMLCSNQGIFFSFVNFVKDTKILSSNV